MKAFAPSADLILKWPNDLLLAGRKLSGILIESNTHEDGWIVVGVGLNIHSAPVIPGRDLAALSSIAVTPSAEQLAQGILKKVADGLSVWASRGETAIRENWLTRAHQIGARLAVASGDAYTEGTFYGLGPEGQLLLLTEGQRVRTFIAGEATLTVKDQNASRH